MSGSGRGCREADDNWPHQRSPDAGANARHNLTRGREMTNSRAGCLVGLNSSNARSGLSIGEKQQGNHPDEELKQETAARMKRVCVACCNCRSTLLSISNCAIRPAEQHTDLPCRQPSPPAVRQMRYRWDGSGGRRGIVGGYLIVTSASLERLVQECYSIASPPIAPTS